jgi:putative transposase
MVQIDWAEQAGVALHITLRARGGAACLLLGHDRQAFLGALGEGSARFGCALHAYVLMGNHAHLLVTPARAGSAARLIGWLHERYARHLAESRAVGLAAWAGPPDASIVHARRHFLSCMRYIEENPMRARLVARPESYRWSSHRANALGEADPLLTPHAHYCALGRTPEARRAAYRALFGARAGVSRPNRETSSAARRRLR